MHVEQTVQRFVELRAQGWSYSRLAGELGVSKRTLISWSRKHFRAIDNLRRIELDSLSEKCHITRQASLQQLSDDLRRVREELAKRDLSEVPTARLITLGMLLRTEVLKAAAPLQLTDEVKPDEPNPPEFANPQITWPG